MLEERWLFEATTECYLPLLDLLDRLAAEGIPTPLALNLSPTLRAMLRDPLLRARYGDELERLRGVASRYVHALPARDPLRPAARHVQERLERIERLRAGTPDLVAAFVAHHQAGRIELLGSALTHPVLPLCATPTGARLQVVAGIEAFRREVGADPTGFWLPECAYAPWLDGLLTEAGAGYTILDAHGVLQAAPSPPGATFAPIRTEAGLTVLARDLACGRQVWSAMDGYPGDPTYREFYRDLGHDGPLDLVADCLIPGAPRHDIGIKLHAVTGAVPLGAKAPYAPAAAAETARRHARHFLEERTAQCLRLAPLLSGPPLVTAPYDAELFGHWWYEGPLWLEALFRAAHEARGVAERGGVPMVRLRTPRQALAERAAPSVHRPIASSWGYNGYFETWVNGRNDWILPRLHGVERRLARAACLLDGSVATMAAPMAEALWRRAALEWMLAGSSDWAFILNTETFPAYASARVEEHLRAAGQSLDLLAVLGEPPRSLAEGGASEARRRAEAWIQEREARTPGLDGRDIPIPGALPLSGAPAATGIRAPADSRMDSPAGPPAAALSSYRAGG